MKPRLKICCISSLEEAGIAVAAGADALGLVSDMPSGPGIISEAVIRQIAQATPPPVATVLLTQKIDGAEIAAQIASVGVNTVQLVRHLDVEEHLRLKEHLPAAVRVIQVIHVEDETALDLIDRYATHIDAFLLDSGRPSAATEELGGTGRTHDWTVSAEFVSRSPKPVFLAGGLNAGNVSEAIENVKPYGLDLCSSVREGDHLSHTKLRAFVAAIRRSTD